MNQAIPPKPRFPAGLGDIKPGAEPAAANTLRPQRLLDEAARDARQRVQVSGLGLDSRSARLRMIDRLRGDGVACEPVLRAMLAVERHAFVDTALASQAYEDTSLPIGWGQTISKPSVVARMLEWAFWGEVARNQGHLGRVLEIGGGCGYQTALLSHLASSVVSMERVQPLHEFARALLTGQGMQRCLLVHADGMPGFAQQAPFDTIISAAGGDDLPQAWLEQLAFGGRLVAPARAADGRSQVLMIVDRRPDGWVRSLGETVQFVPLKSGLA